MSRKVLTLSERVEAIKLHDGEKFSRCCTDNGQPIYYIYIHTHVHVYIYVKPPDEYPWQGQNSFNSGVIWYFEPHGKLTQKIVNLLNYRSPLFSSQFLSGCLNQLY